MAWYLFPFVMVVVLAMFHYDFFVSQQKGIKDYFDEEND